MTITIITVYHYCRNEVAIKQLQMTMKELRKAVDDKEQVRSPATAPAAVVILCVGIMYCTCTNFQGT